MIEDYNRKKPFSNFLPGIAGLYGTPMWAFYVNRGQGMASFGTRDKDNSILEFFPANKAYQMVSQTGFRTFVKLSRRGKPYFYEPFRLPSARSGMEVRQVMEIASHEFTVREINKTLGLEFSATYYTIPGESTAALVRELAVTNTSGEAVTVEALDGLPQVNPYGMNEFFVKQMSRTIEAWMSVENLNRRAAYFRLKVDATDRPEVTFIEEGNFAFAFTQEASRQGKLIDPVVDPDCLFGPQLDFAEPRVFYATPLYKTPVRQRTENKTPCAFFTALLSIGPGRSKKIVSFFGQAKSLDGLNRFVASASRGGYLAAKREENRQLIESIKSRLFTVSSNVAFDLYCGQTYLDNVLRGGLPQIFGEGESRLSMHVYSRKHGDLERDYNRFLVEPMFFSQGDGNYRDVNQNRRSDVWFEPSLRDSNIKTFLNLIQLDGYNPLVIKGTRFSLKKSAASLSVIRKWTTARGVAALEQFFSKPFSIGALYEAAVDKGGLVPKAKFEGFVSALAAHVSREEKAEHGEGFWVDHWTYNLDLIENYLAIYPEDQKALLFDRREYTFHDSDHVVRPRSQKYFMKKAGMYRQYRSVVKDKEKATLINSRVKDASFVRVRAGRGEIYRTTLFAKLTLLFTQKLATLDPEGVGIEMEADKPSWYDALNGLPGLVGSSICETFELKRLGLFLIHAIEDLGLDAKMTIALPVELYDMIHRIEGALVDHFRSNSAGKNFEFWNRVTGLKEAYRSRTRLGLSGKEKSVTIGELKSFFEHGREKIELGIDRAFNPKTRLYPTYFENEIVEARISKKKDGVLQVDPRKFRSRALPNFLEGPVHALKVEKDPAKRSELLRAVRESGLYDKKLGMYKVNASIKEASLEIGRARVFAPGWLENESIWLHMEYKFILELLKCGMADEFYRDFFKALVPFQPAERYGRSILENSSFIVSSEFSDETIHGMGFVARLSGSTAEFLQMWLLMNIGKRPFILGPDGKLSLRFQPTLPASFFTEVDSARVYTDPTGSEHKIRVPKDAYAFLFLGKTLVTYRNPKRLDTYGRQRASVKKILLKGLRGGDVEFRGDTVPSPYAARVREGAVPQIEIELG